MKDQKRIASAEKKKQISFRKRRKDLCLANKKVADARYELEGDVYSPGDC